MDAKTAYEKAAGLLNQWYTMIKRHEALQAVSLKHEIENLLSGMEKHGELQLYFYLLDYRFKLMTEQFAESAELFREIKRQKNAIRHADDIIQYYFYFFSGMYEFYEKNYYESISCYKKAENKLYKITDDIERAEFHYKIAIAYYQIDDHFRSLNHAEKALSIFSKHEEYIDKAIGCEMLLGSIQFDLFRMKQAEEHYKRALDQAVSFHNQRIIGLIYHNMGQNYANQSMPLLAEEHFRKALAVDIHKQSVFGIYTIFEWSHVLYKNGRREEARQLCKEGFSRSVEQGEEEYTAKFRLIFAVYDTGNPLDIEFSLEYLADKKLWPHVAELTKDIADYYTGMGDDERSAVYLEKSLYAKNQICKVKEEFI
ncbi:tetratricopeptide repeat protein [Bacillus swezeyi]|uniref:tetratricopeptide repeat protein n=1 Tax=Bacillus swezeyi TaxID=1925020 RepID=UPI0013DE7342|nr:tetratricopeptide repeat protein [Bacillus swezeyi]MEC1263085.1 tetratricopeptide repeat protein [Bacillus swezeyi]MED2930387.1 tetratricopeptide repeat protein [Bacillus swezeyi]MED2944580.1 tetratricopeptide repeat protein [Bacillus swezeyi]MED2963929.1 tetratricopeptide repeat protein [Bacillus swezeyi]MED2975181.1 tetratricopeptide repeat protein [Bacillus swezeyi]